MALLAPACVHRQRVILTVASAATNVPLRSVAVPRGLYALTGHRCGAVAPPFATIEQVNLSKAQRNALAGLVDVLQTAWIKRSKP